MIKTKKLFLLIVAAVLTLVCAVSSTVSWYSHNGSENGKRIHYAENLPLSIKTTATLGMNTFECDKNGVVADGASSVSAISVQPNSVVYYKTTLTNSGTDPVMFDFEVNTLPNNADFLIGTVLPTLNEKAFASRAVRSKTSDNKVRVYFKTHSGMASYWSQDNYDKTLVNEKGTYEIGEHGELTNIQYTYDNYAAGSTYQSNDATGTLNDINISFTVNGKEYQSRMEKCPTNDTENVGGTGTNYVFYYDLPSNTDSFFFFNHWYLRSGSNRDWNRTIDIRDLSAGKLYYLTNGKVDGKWKEYKARPVDHTLLAVNNYYQNVRMSMGDSVSADISLKKESESDDEEFVPDYFGSNISYGIKEGSLTGVVSVTSDGLLIPKGYGDTVVETTIAGRYGDTRTVETSVSVPEYIDQVPIMKNIKIEGSKSVDVYWYARNNSASATMLSGTLFITQ